MGQVEMETTMVHKAVAEAIQKYGVSQDELIPILNEINRQVGYLPGEALQAVAEALRVPKSQIFSVASFYRMLSTKPRGKHTVQFCESAPCHVAGGRQVWEALQDHLGITAGETTPDNQWTLVTVSCLGICGVGPVMMVDEDIYGNLTPEQIPNILGKYQ